MLTDAAGMGSILTEVSIETSLTALREIVDITSDPLHPGLANLIGARAGGKLRGALQAQLPEDRELGTALHLLLDDLAGASLVAGWCFSQWTADWAQRVKGSTGGEAGRMEGICAGFRTGSSALATDGGARHDIQSSAPVGPLVDPRDRDAMHTVPDQGGEPAMRRARWLDLWREDDCFAIAMGFQDSATTPAGGRIGVHEYELSAIIGGDDMILREIRVEPRVLPYGECLAAAPNAQRMLGRPVGTFRDAVLDELKGTAGCTHLNDMLRMLGDVPQLAGCLT